MALRTVGVRLTAEITQYQQRMREAGRTAVQLRGELDTAARAGRLDAVADRAGALGVGLLAAGGTAVKFAMDFEKSMSAVSAATHASERDMGRLKDAAIEAGKDTQYSATEAANAITELSKAGVSTADVLGGGLTGALNLAAAGQLDVAEAAETAASAMVQFGLDGKDVPHIADLLAAAAGKAQGSVHDMGFALNQSGLVASQFGLSIEDTTGVLAQFANAGLIGSDAGTSFKTMLLALANPAGETKDRMKDLGISFYDANGAFIGLSGVAQELQLRLGHLTEEQRNATLGQIFGSDAIRAATILYRDGAAGVDEWRRNVNDAGYAAETAAKLTDNLAGDVERLKGELETLAIQSGGGANSGLRVVAQSAEALVAQFGRLDPAVSGTVTVLAILGGALTLGAAGWVKMRRSNALALEELRATGPAGTRAAAGLQRVSTYAGRAAGAFAALTVIDTVIAQFQEELNPQVEALAAGFADYAASGKLAGESSRLLGGDLEKLDGKFQILADTSAKSQWARALQAGLESIVPGLKGTNESLANTRERVVAMDEALANLVSSGQAGEAERAFDRLAKSLATGDVTMEEFRRQFPQYAAAVEVAGKESVKTADAIGEVDSAASAAEQQVDELSDAFDDLFDVQMTADRAALKLAESTKDLTAELLDGRRTLKLNSEEGRKNRSAVLDQIDAIDDMRKARLDHGESMDEASRKYERDIDGLKRTMRQAGFNKKEIDRLVDSYRDIPGRVKTDVSITGNGAVEGKLSRLAAYQEALKKGVPVKFHGPVRGSDGRYYAGGGPVRGPGTGTSDDIPAWLSNGEHVWTAGEVAALGGQQAMTVLRAAVRGGKSVEIGDEAPGYARGGAVGWPYPVTARGTRIPSREEARDAVIPDAPLGGATGEFMRRMLEARFGVGMISGPRPGARTLSGNASYHGASPYRAVDFPPLLAMAKYMYENYRSQLREAITPFQQYNVHNGRSHRYTGAVWNQHNFAGGNAHNHFAMAQGGVIREPVFGLGASGATYSFGENYQPERVVPMSGAGGGGATTVNVTVNAPVGSSPREIGRQVADVLDSYCRGGGRVQLRGEVRA